MSERSRILVVDDEESVCAMLVAAIKKAGHEVAACSGGAAAIEYLKDNQVDVVLSDVIMPDVGGIDLVRWIKENRAGVDVVLMTGYAAIDTAGPAIRLGVVDYLIKPFAELKLVTSTVDRVLQKRELQRELDRRTQELHERNLELSMKNVELLKLNEFKNSVLRRLADEADGLIPQLIEQARSIADDDSVAESAKSAASAIIQSSRQIEEVLAPVDFYTEVVATLRGRTILVAVSGHNARRLLLRALRSTGATVVAVSDLASIDIGDRTPDVVYADRESSQLVQQLQDQYPAIHTVLITDQPGFTEYLAEIHELPAQSILISDDLVTRGQKATALIQQIVITAGKLLSGDIFGVEKYLTWGAALHSAPVSGTTAKVELLSELERFADSLALKRSEKRNLRSLADELLMNAIWDAPVDQDGQLKYYYRDRRESIDLLPNEVGTLRYGSDGNRLAIGVSDPFGRLTRDTAYRYLARCLSGGEEQINQGAGSAGLGLFVSFHTSSTLVVNVSPGVRTEVIGLIDLGVSSQVGAQRAYQYFTAAA